LLQRIWQLQSDFRRLHYPPQQHPPAVSCWRGCEVLLLAQFLCPARSPLVLRRQQHAIPLQQPLPGGGFRRTHLGSLVQGGYLGASEAESSFATHSDKITAEAALLARSRRVPLAISPPQVACDQQYDQ